MKLCHKWFLPLLTNLIVDKYKHQIKYRQSVLHLGMPIPKWQDLHSICSYSITINISFSGSAPSKLMTSLLSKKGLYTFLSLLCVLLSTVIIHFFQDFSTSCILHHIIAFSISFTLRWHSITFFKDYAIKILSLIDV